MEDAKKLQLQSRLEALKTQRSNVQADIKRILKFRDGYSHECELTFQRKLLLAIDDAILNIKNTLGLD